jgi:P27 family predicted phage terminase small subunit
MRDRIPRPTRGRLSKEARKWWDVILNDFDLESASLLILESALEAFDRMRQAAIEVDRDGVTVKDRYDVPKEHPALSIQRSERAAMQRGIKMLGIDLEPIADIGRPPRS